MAEVHWGNLKGFSLPVLIGFHGSATNFDYHYAFGKVKAKQESSGFFDVVQDEECKHLLESLDREVLLREPALLYFMVSGIDSVYYYAPAGTVLPPFLTEQETSPEPEPEPEPEPLPEPAPKPGPEGDAMSDTNNSEKDESRKGPESSEGDSATGLNPIPDGSIENSDVVVRARQWSEGSLKRRVSSGARPPGAILNDIEVVRRYVSEGLERPSSREDLAKLHESYRSEIVEVDGAVAGKRIWVQNYFMEVLKISSLVSRHAREWAPIETFMVDLSDRISFLMLALTDYMNAFLPRLQQCSSVKALEIPSFALDESGNQSVGSLDELLGRIQMVFEFAVRDCLVMAQELEKFAAPIRTTIEPWLGDAICLSNPDRWEWVLYRHRKELLNFESRAKSSASTAGSFLPLILLGPMGGIIQMMQQKDKDLEVALTRKAAVKTIRDNKELKELMANLYRDSGSLFDISIAATGALRTLNTHWEGLADGLQACERECTGRYDAAGIYVRCFERMVQLMAVIKKNVADVSESLKGC